jgi:hypothetical protein
MSAHHRRKRRLLSQTGLATPQRQPFRATGHEIMNAMFTGLGETLREDMGAAMASLMLSKPCTQVTSAEAAEALHRALKITDPLQRNRVIREGWRAVLARLSPKLVPTAYAGDLAATLTRLDDGDAEAGVLTPTPTTRHGGGEARNRERILGVEVAFQMGSHKTSRDRAIQIATGVGRGNWNWTQPPTLPWAADLRSLQRAVDAAWEAARPGETDEAMAEGGRLYRGESPSPEFLRFRQDYLRLWSGGEAALESCDKKSAQIDTDFRKKSA